MKNRRILSRQNWTCYVVAVICLFQLLVPEPTLAQMNKDQLLDLIKSDHNNDSTLAAAYLRLCSFQFNRNLDSAKIYLDKGLVHAKQSGNKNSIALNYAYLAAFYRFKGELDHAEKAIAESEKYIPNIESSAAHRMNIFNQAVIHNIHGEYKKSINSFFTYLELNEKEGRWTSVGEAYNSISILYKEIGDQKKSLDYLYKSLQVFKQHGKPYHISLALGNLASQYIELSQWDSVIFHGNATLKIGEENKYQRTEAFAHQVLAEGYLGLNKINEALIHAEQSVTIYNEIGEAKLIINPLISIAQVRAKQGQFTQAILELQKAEYIADTLQFLSGQLSTLHYMQETYESMGDFESALTAHKKMNAINDSIQSEQHRELINDLDKKYETAEKNIQITNQELEIQKKTQQRNIVLFGVLLLGIASYFVYKNQRYKHRLAQEKLNVLQEKNKLDSLKNVLKGQESERQRIARDLHDGLGGLLATTRLSIQQQRKTLSSDNAMGWIDKIEGSLTTIYEEVRRIAHDMMPSALINMGLQSALEDLANRINTTKSIKLNTLIILKKDLRNDLEISIYRIVQEAVNNAIKYAQAQNIMVQLIQNETHLHLTIEDDGVGFDADQETGGIGLSNIRSRVEYLGGTLSIDPAPGKGVSIDIVIPEVI